MQQRFQNAAVEAGLRKDFCKKSFNKNTPAKTAEAKRSLQKAKNLFIMQGLFGQQQNAQMRE
jgi:hypothetical protein